MNKGETNMDEKKALLMCEEIRCNLPEYDESILTDITQGHWDLYGEPVFDDKLVERNPLDDVKDKGVVGIDFGTKSTVVVFLDSREISRSMRIGVGNINEKATPKHYENPTVLQFLNYQDFMDAYMAKAGRPDTKWNQLTVSHTAAGSLLDGTSDDYMTHFDKLKQWIGGNITGVKLEDKSGTRKEKELKDYLDIEEGDFDPVELYAYYIGLYINNMHYSGGQIFINYLLSYPATYERKILDKLVLSFERGIKKSLPIPVLEDDETMKKFKVELSISEPEAYAICALDEYDLAPSEEDKIHYGVFDFGGGTTDFAYGAYSKVTDPRERRRYGYQIESFGDERGDKYLGGENLLELIAYEVFKNNEDLLRTNSIYFTIPKEIEADKPSRLSDLIQENKVARLNTVQLVRALRPLWEKNEDYSEDKFNTFLKGVVLRDKEGNDVTGIDLVVNGAELEKILHDRIERGVVAFFNGAIASFALNEDNKNIKKINIFLAGNSSRSDIFRKIFTEYVETKCKEIIGEIAKFEVFPPLGSPEAEEIQNGKNAGEDIEKLPSGKTGVAFGLVKGRPGGRIKIVRKAGKDINFKFCVGFNADGKFEPVPEAGKIEYDSWYWLADVERSYDMYYSGSPTARFTGKLPIEEALREPIILGEDYGRAIGIYFRAVSPSVIEYVGCDKNLEEGDSPSDYLFTPIKVTLKD